ncbi:MAG: DNA-binding domain-containing protein [Aquisalimonadaceae bacterium]
MRSLSDIQAQFVTALRSPAEPPPCAIAGPGDQRPVRRFNVYRNNVHVSLVDALAATYPTVLRLVGEEFFRAMARVFVGHTLPRTPVLIHYGGGFPDFIEQFEPAASVPYLGDVARLDWAWLQAFHAADARPMDPAALARVPGDRLENLLLHPHPSVAVVESNWPVVSFWAANRSDAQTQRLRADGAETALICRPALNVQVARMPPGTARFVAALRTGKTLAEAARTAAQHTTEFPLAETLRGLLSHGALTAHRFRED